MTQEEQRNLQILESNVRKMMDLVRLQDETIRQLTARESSLQEALKLKDREIEILQTENATLTSGKGLISGSDSLGDAQRKVNEMIQNIDRCIKLLETR